MPAPDTTPHPRSQPRISVLLAEDRPFVRDGIKCVLERHADIQVVATVADGSAAVREVESCLPQVVVMSTSMPGMNGLEATKIIVDKWPGIAVLMLSMHASASVVRRAVEAGARGCLGKDAATEEFVRAVRIVADGKRYIGQGLAQSLLDVGKGGRAGDATVEVLTATERSILKLVVDGHSNARVAATLGLSPRTVETYRLRLMRKLGIDHLPALVKYAIRQGIVSLD